MIQSAEEFAYAVRGIKEYQPQKTGEYVMQQKDYAPISQGAAIELIRSRDKAIIERCKNMIRGKLAIGALRQGTPDFGYWEDALDSVLRELFE